MQMMNIVNNLIALGYSRKDELESDRLAVRYTYNAGYDPYGLVSFMRKLEVIHKDDTPAILNFLRTHPPHNQREKILEEEITRIKQSEQ